MISARLEELLSAIGWRASEIAGQRHTTVYVSTPLRLAGGKPLDFYLVQEGDRIEFTDDGLTLFALRALGLALHDRRNWRGLRDAAAHSGFELRDSGEFTASFLESDLPQWGPRIVELFAAITAWEAERRAQHDEDFSLTREVERIMRLRDPLAAIVEAPRINIGGGDELAFDFLWGNTYVETVAPVVQSVNAKLRKAILLAREFPDNVPLLFVVDDRIEAARAEHELGILGQVARATRFSDFARDYVVH